MALFNVDVYALKWPINAICRLKFKMDVTSNIFNSKHINVHCNL